MGFKEELSKINKVVPTRPISTPTNWILLNTTPKNKVATIKAFKEVIEFKIEATELSIPVIANAKKNAGNNVPSNELTTIYFQWCFLIFFRLLNPMERMNIPAINVLKAPNWTGVKPIKDFLISIKESELFIFKLFSAIIIFS